MGDLVGFYPTSASRLAAAAADRLVEILDAYHPSRGIKCRGTKCRGTKCRGLNPAVANQVNDLLYGAPSI